jgi:hypothetical protein
MCTVGSSVGTSARIAGGTQPKPLGSCSTSDSPSVLHRSTMWATADPATYERSSELSMRTPASPVRRDGGTRRHLGMLPPEGEPGVYGMSSRGAAECVKEFSKRR